MGVFLAQDAKAALNPAYTIGVGATQPAIGKVSSGTITTNFVVDTAGAISISPTGLTTTGQFIPYTTSSRSSPISITVTCTGNKCGNSGQTSTVTITGTSTVSGRFGQIVGINALLPAGLLSPSGTTVSTAGSTLTFTLNPFTGTKTIHLGMTVPVATSGSAGTATANWTATILGNNSSTQTGNSQATGSVEARLSISSVTNLDFGKVFLTRDGSGTIVSGTLTWDAATQTFSASPAGVVVNRGSNGSIGKFSVSGTPGQTLHFNITGPGLPTVLTLTSPQGLTVNLTPSMTGTSAQTIPSGPPTPGTFNWYFGGTINVGPTVHTGVFGATINLTVYYE